MQDSVKVGVNRNTETLSTSELVEAILMQQKKILQLVPGTLHRSLESTQKLFGKL